VPTGVMALSRLVFFSGSARNPSRIALTLSSSRFCFSYMQIRMSDTYKQGRGQQDMGRKTTNHLEFHIGRIHEVLVTGRRRRGGAGVGGCTGSRNLGCGSIEGLRQVPMPSNLSLVVRCGWASCWSTAT